MRRLDSNRINTPLGRRLTRRRFVQSAAAAAGLALTAGPLTTLSAPSSPRTGALVSDPNGIVDLPPGFNYRVIADLDTIYTDGTPRPGAADGMGAFPGPNNTTLLCVNHENRSTASRPVPAVNGDYNPAERGGTSVMLVGPDGDLLQAWPSSSGTIRNCAGGVTPWGTWITCEESEAISGDYSHGWAFEVDPYAPLDGGTPQQVRLDTLGRFYKEALAIDPNTRVVYQTEDLADGFFYRFVPAPGVWPDGFGDYATAEGALQALVIPGLSSADAATTGTSYTPTWANVPDPDGIPVLVRKQTYADAGGAVVTPTRFYRGEGAWWSTREQAVYFDATGGGTSGHWGQIWRYTPASNTLTLVYVSHDKNVLEMPDNLTILPWGDVLLCEDGGGDNYLRVLTQRGAIVDLARNSLAEFAGACFTTSPDTLYVNIQGESITLAIRGPWPTLRG